VTLDLGGAWWRFGIKRLNVEDKLNECTCDECRGQMCRKIMVEEELTTHDVKGKVMSCPSNEEEPRGVVETGTSACNHD